MQQNHRFFDPGTGKETVATLLDVLYSGVPIDPGSGKDLEYLGPVEPIVVAGPSDPNSYAVIYSIDVGGDTPQEAAEDVFGILRDAGAMRPIFLVVDPTGHVVTVDLEDTHPA